jgi:two-component system, response regulator
MTNLVEILLVEDNVNDIELTMRALGKNRLSNRVHVARDGEEALNFILARGPYSERRKQHNPKVVFLDLKLPKVDGLEVLRVLKSDEQTRMIPVVVLTSSKEERDIVESYKLGVNSYIVKPVDFEKFAKAISEIGFYWVLLNQPVLPK